MPVLPLLPLFYWFRNSLDYFGVVVSRTEANDICSMVTVVPLSSVKGKAAERLVQPLLLAKDSHLPKIRALFATKSEQ
jgi:hypothetical protein